MKIVLVSLYDVNNFAVRILKTVLSQNGYNVSIMTYKEDYVEESLTWDEIGDIVNKIHFLKPDIVGFTLRSMIFQEFQRIAPLIDARIIVGGQHPTVCPEDFAGYADTICIGDGEDVICDIVEGRNGIVYGGMAKDLNTIPSAIVLPKQRMSVITSRGCFFNCSYCYNGLQRKIIKGWRPRRRTVDNVMTEINQLKKVVPILDEIVFSDSIFTWNYDWMFDFCKEFKETGLKFRCFGHYALIDPKMIALMASSGCHMITAGFQGSERVRKKYYNKKETDEQVIEGCKMITTSGITSRCDRIKNLPYETEEDRDSVKNLIGRMPTPFVLRSFDLLHNPKTELTNRLLRDGHITKNDIQGSCTKSYKLNAEFTCYEDK